MKKRDKWQKRWNYQITAAFTLIFAILFVVGFYLTQNILLNNSQKLGANWPATIPSKKTAAFIRQKYCWI